MRLESSPGGRKTAEKGNKPAGRKPAAGVANGHPHHISI